MEEILFIFIIAYLMSLGFIYIGYFIGYNLRDHEDEEDSEK